MANHKISAALFVCASIVLSTQPLLAQGPAVGHAGDSVRAKGQSEGAGAPEIVPHRLNPNDASAPAGSTDVITPDITYHGGPVMGTPNVYLIWYGNWNQSNASDTPAGQQIIRDFLFGLSGSDYYFTNTSYGTPTGTFAVKGEYTDSYSQGARLSDFKVQNVVMHAINSALPKDRNGVYFVLTSSDVAETSGFCSKYCGWHTSGRISGLDIKYAFVGNSFRCLNACAAQTVGPNGNAGVDGMVSVIAHELEETNTDPDFTAWFDSNGAEDADKCAWTFGSNQQQAPNGGFYNMTLPTAAGGSRHYLIQRELDVNSKCYVDYINKIQ